MFSVTKLLSAAVLLLACSSGMAASITLGQISTGGVSAVITPDSTEIGSSTNVYMAALLNGRIYVRNSSSNWTEYTGGALPIALSGQVLTTSTTVQVTSLNITGLSGMDLYVAYGNSESEFNQKPGHLAKIYTVPTASTTSRFKGEVWADNWFSLYVGDKLVAEDSVPITTERSFNAETFTFDASYPFDLNFIIKDFKENDTGLEYIGTSRQQMGDGGFIAQITDTNSGKVVAVSSSSWKCSVIHKAPLNKTCAQDTNPSTTCTYKIDSEPATWKNTGYDVSGWESASVYTATQVGAKDGYNSISWNSAAQIIWTSDLQADNTLLCKATVTGN